MFRRAVTLLGKRPLTGFAMFLKSTRGDKGLNVLPVVKRGKELGKRWWALSDAERAAFVAKGKKTLVTVSPRRSSKAKSNRKPRKPSAYNRFVSANWKKVADGPATKKLAAIAKLWNKSK